MIRDFKGRNFIVTGGSRGIGTSIVNALASLGGRVAFTYNSNSESADQVLKSLPGEGHFCVKMNLNSEEEIERAFALISEKMNGEIHGLVNNAGMTRDGLLVRMKTEDFDSVINANLRGSFILTKLVSKGMMKARQGSIVNITSVVGITGNAGQANYAASKAGLIGFSRSVAQELGSRGVRVNCVAPGFIATDMTEVLSDEVKENILSQIPLGKMGDPSDIAHAVSFLLSDEAKYITGHTLSVNGGMHMN